MPNFCKWIGPVGLMMLFVQQGTVASPAINEDSKQASGSKYIQLAQSTVRVGRLNKRTSGIIVGTQQGDVSCYIIFNDNQRRKYSEHASEDACDQAKKLRGRRVALRYTQEKVMADECQGSPDCTKSKMVAMVSSVRAIAASSRKHKSNFKRPSPGTSWGGKVRNGPGINYRQTDSLRKGTSIQLVERTSTIFNGYPWFKISYRDPSNGAVTIGYQWGGIICSSARTPGVHSVCPPNLSRNSGGRATARQPSLATQPRWCSALARGNPAQRTICANNARLWELDNVLTRRVTALRQRGRLNVNAQLQWIKWTRNGCGADISCLTDVYQKRIKTLSRGPTRVRRRPAARRICKSEPGCPCVNGRKVCH